MAGTISAGVGAEPSKPLGEKATLAPAPLWEVGTGSPDPLEGVEPEVPTSPGDIGVGASGAGPGDPTPFGVVGPRASIPRGGNDPASSGTAPDTPGTGSGSWGAFAPAGSADLVTEA